MTGRDLIMYILQNHLEDEEMFKDGKIPGLMTLDAAAVKFGVGPETVLTWYHRGKLPGCKIVNEIYIFETAEHPWYKKEDNTGVLRRSGKCPWGEGEKK